MANLKLYFGFAMFFLLWRIYCKYTNIFVKIMKFFFKIQTKHGLCVPRADNARRA